MINTLPGGFPVATFLKDHWQKRPCLIRQAFTDTSQFVSGAELAGLALEPNLESRLVLEKGGDHPWQVIQGPFKAQSFRTLPETHWSLLVQGVERLLPAAAKLLENFRFIPNWRLDDVMISYAPDQGSVGPHIDNYDVFLIQGSGRRIWRVGKEGWPENDFIPGLDLKILKSFNAEHEYTLEAGDMLYLPPRFAHHGIAVGPSITYSVGFRAPQHQEIVAGYASYAAGLIEGDWHYTDPDLEPQSHAGEITAQTFQRLSEVLTVYLKDGDALRDWFGKYMTEPKNDVVLRRPDEAYEEADIFQRIKAGEAMKRTEGGRIAFVRGLQAGIGLYADGNAYHLANEDLDCAVLLSESATVDGGQLEPMMSRPAIRQCVVGLFNDGFLYFPEDWEEG